RSSTRRGQTKWTSIIMVLMSFWSSSSAQFRYSVLEEAPEGTIVGNIGKDLGLDNTMRRERGMRIVYGSKEPPFIVKQDDGVLYVNGKIDREEICERRKDCLIDLKLVLQNPLEINHVIVEIVDVNDNSPIFQQKENILDVSESALPGAKFQLQAARDADSGLLSVQQYRLSQNRHFRLDVKDRGEDRKTPSLVLEKPLDRESVKSHVLLLTALDGGKPPKSGNMTIVVNVSDANDNPPVFSQESYTVSLKENSPVGTTVIQVSATDLDEGSNGQVEYSFGNDVDAQVRERFNINRETGVIVVSGTIDFEECSRYEIDVQASDKGTATLNTETSVIINIVDLNDNEPEVEVTSFSQALPEDSKPGTTVALISVKDADSGLNGKVMCYINPDIPFLLTPSENMYAVVTKSRLDREMMAQYDVTISAKDEGEPPFSSEKTMKVVVSDVNDNVPEFVLSPYTFYITENNNPGASVFSVKAYDQDDGDNALISYHILREKGSHDTLTSFLNINAETGSILALKSFDFETLKTFQFQVVATDSGTPSLSSNGSMNIQIHILDVNDNVPVFSSDAYSVTLRENSPLGTTVVQVNATDLDDGTNGEVIYSLGKSTNQLALNIFDINPITGDITVKGLIDYEERDKYEIEIEASDKGIAPLTTEKSVNIKIID
uniref:Protocadherin 2 alpha a 15 n=1 Tax=Poecilia formosa TaxID=48698 RepID=A0A096M8N2_POEFO